MELVYLVKKEYQSQVETFFRGHGFEPVHETTKPNSTREYRVPGFNPIERELDGWGNLPIEGSYLKARNQK